MNMSKTSVIHFERVQFIKCQLAVEKDQEAH